MLVGFAGFAVFWLGERVRWNYGSAFALILAARYFAFLPGASTRHRRARGSATALRNSA